MDSLRRIRETNLDRLQSQTKDPISMEPLMGIPLFCVEAKDKVAGKKLYINFRSTDTVEHPEVDLDEDQLVKEICNPSPNIEEFKIPLKLSQIFWTKDPERHYVIDVHINDKFAIRRVLASDVIRHYVIIVSMMTIEQKYNNPTAVKDCGQFIGHELSLDQAGYEVLTNKQSFERSSNLVNNKILLIDAPKPGQASSTKVNIETTYDLYYRPASQILTCSVNTDKVPDSIGFNEDRIIVKRGDKTLLDLYLPFYIDLREPVKYKFDDRSCLFRAVFKINETI